MESYSVQRVVNKTTRPLLFLEPNLDIDEVRNLYNEIKEEFGLTYMQLAWTLEVTETTIENTFKNNKRTGKPLLFTLYLALKEYRSFYETKEIQKKYIEEK